MSEGEYIRAALIEVGKHQIILQADERVWMNGGQQIDGGMLQAVRNAVKEANTLRKKYGMGVDRLNFQAHMIAGFLSGRYIGQTTLTYVAEMGVQL